MLNFIKPMAPDEDLRRREFIFNILVVTIICLIIIAIASSSITYFFLSDPISRGNSAVSFFMLFAELFFFLALYACSRKGFFVFASYIFLAILFLLGCYMWYMWGVDVVIGILLEAIVIIMSGILISSRFAFFTTSVIAGTMIAMGYAQYQKLIVVNQYWKQEVWRPTDMIVVSFIFALIAVISWLSNREIEKSLTRARKSEAELKKERDSLEITVETRTKELKEVQAEKISQLYRFAEFGRLSSGLFHDLINPLTAVSLNMEKLKQGGQLIHDHPVSVAGDSERLSVSQAAEYVDKAVQAAGKLEDLVVSVRKQLARQENNAIFSLSEEIYHVIDVLSYKAKKAGVVIQYVPAHDAKTFGDAVKFNQVALNLIANAIDAYEDIQSQGKIILVSLQEKNGNIIFSVKDSGMGIPKENMQKIFEPFFTTKTEGRGIGIGLSMTKRIVEKDFKGTISVESDYGKGTVFNVMMPE